MSTTPGENPRPLPQKKTSSPRPPLPGAGDDRDKPTSKPAPRPPLPGAGDDKDKPSVPVTPSGPGASPPKKPAPKPPIIDTKPGGETDASGDKTAGPSKKERDAKKLSKLGQSAFIRTRERELQAEIKGRQDSDKKRRTAKRLSNNARVAAALRQTAKEQKFTKLPFVNKNLKKIAGKLDRDETLTQSQAETAIAALERRPGKADATAIRFRPNRGGISFGRAVKAAQEISLLGFIGSKGKAKNPTIKIKAIPRINPQIARSVSKAQKAAAQRRAAKNRISTARRFNTKVKTLKDRRTTLRTVQANLREARAANDKKQIARTQAQVKAAGKAVIITAVSVSSEAVSLAATDPKVQSNLKTAKPLSVTVNVNKASSGIKAQISRARPIPITDPLKASRTKVTQGIRPAPTPTPTPPPVQPKTQVKKPTIVAPKVAEKAIISRPPSKPPVKVAKSTTGFPGGSAPATARPASSTKKKIAPIIPPLPAGDDKRRQIKGSSFHPVRFNWKQGARFKTANLVTGKIRTTSSTPPGGIRSGIGPKGTIKAVGFADKPGKKRAFDIGTFVASVNGRRITFKKDTGQPAIRERGFSK